MDTFRISEEKVMDKILEALPPDNYELYVLHEPGGDDDDKLFLWYV